VLMFRQFEDNGLIFTQKLPRLLIEHRQQLDSLIGGEYRAHYFEE